MCVRVCVCVCVVERESVSVCVCVSFCIRLWIFILNSTNIQNSIFFDSRMMKDVPVAYLSSVIACVLVLVRSGLVCMCSGLVWSDPVWSSLVY